MVGAWSTMTIFRMAARRAARSAPDLRRTAVPSWKCSIDDGQRRAATTEDYNHVWVEDLEPDRLYRYQVTVNDRRWAEGELWDWRVGPDGGTFAPSGRRYDLRFRTHPDPQEMTPVAFLALGDYGVGITNGDDGHRQLAVARCMEQLAATHSVRAIVSLGDNIYHGPEDELAQSGDEDDDWYFTFYAPYRYLIDHLPVYPTAGNHDGADEEANDDRAQLADNFHLESRFSRAQSAGRASGIRGCSIASASAACSSSCASTRPGATASATTTSLMTSTGPGWMTAFPPPGTTAHRDGGSRSHTIRPGVPARTTKGWRNSSSSCCRATSGQACASFSPATSTTSNTGSTARCTMSSPALAASSTPGPRPVGPLPERRRGQPRATASSSRPTRNASS